MKCKRVKVLDKMKTVVEEKNIPEEVYSCCCVFEILQVIYQGDISSCLFFPSY